MWKKWPIVPQKLEILVEMIYVKKENLIGCKSLGKVACTLVWPMPLAQGCYPTNFSFQPLFL
jgi:hypothetical protein